MLMDQGLLIQHVSGDYIARVPKEIKSDFTRCLVSFFKNEIGKFGNYYSTKNALVYRSLSTVDGFNQEVLLLRIIQDNSQVIYLANSSTLRYVGTSVSFGIRQRRWGQSIEQGILSRMGIPMLPFTAFQETGLKVVNTKVLDKGPEETLKRQTKLDAKKQPVFEDVHFTGASLFTNESKTFLFDVDREELKHGIFNPFIVEIPVQVSTISNAYRALIPDEVKSAQEIGLKVLRQGEHFFIKKAEKSDLKPDKEKSRWTDSVEFKTARLSAQGNRDHVCSLFNEKTGLVSGFVSHQGREHKDLDLNDGWYKPVPNTAVRSFTIVGDVD